MTVLAVDLAAKYSAFCLMDDNFDVLNSGDSWLKTEDAFLHAVTRPFADSYTSGYGVPEVMVVEDLPHGLSYSTLIKDVCRLQGRLYHAMDDLGHGADMLFLAPAQWRSAYDGMGRGTGADVVIEVAARYDYHPPGDLTQRAKGNGGKTMARKVATDYCSAYLIARWAVMTKQQQPTLDVVGTSRYRTRAITKKDVAA